MTVTEVYKALCSQFRTTSQSPELDARILISHVLGFDSGNFILHSKDPVDEHRLSIIMEKAQRHSEGTPIAYITGCRAFYRSVFLTDEHVLIPQPDTETLVEDAVNTIARNYKNKKKISILDVCAGTGCIGISVALELAPRFEEIELYLSDISSYCIELCRKNAKAILEEQNPANIRVHMNQGDLFEGLEDLKFDAILSNPPYIRSSVIPALDIEVRNEPHLALDGGEDGLVFYRRICSGSHAMLEKGGLLELEIGYDQASEISDLLSAAGYLDIEVLKDLGGNDRVAKCHN